MIVLNKILKKSEFQSDLIYTIDADIDENNNT